jgi:hypothetical protein
MSNEIYLYGLSEDGGKTFSMLKDMRHGDDTSYWAFGVKVQGSEWHSICPVSEALAAPKMREALEALLADYKSGADSGDWGYWDFEGMPVVKHARAALAACGPGYTDPRDEEIKRLRDGLKLALSTDGGLSSGNEDEHEVRACCRALSWKDHESHCWVIKARAALNTKGT